MTIHRFLSEADSAEIEAWRMYFEVEAERQEEQQKKRAFERELGA